MDRDLFNRLSASPAAFREVLQVEAVGELAPLASILDPRQQADFTALDDALLSAAGVDTQPEYRRHWWERCRGSSKSQDAAVGFLWLLAFSRRPVRLIGVAVDQVQAGQLSDAVARLVRANPWLEPLVTTGRWQAENPTTGSRLTIEASDAASSYGWLADGMLFDELSMWHTDHLWQSGMSAAAKKPRCVVVAAMNSGYIGSWPHSLRELIRQDESWRFSHCGTCQPV